MEEDLIVVIMIVINVDVLVVIRFLVFSLLVIFVLKYLSKFN